MFAREGKIWRADVQGSGQELLTDTVFYPGEAGLTFHWRPPHVSPDGRLVVVPGSRGTLVLNLQNDEAWRLSGDPAWVAWSPDSRTMAYVLGDVLYTRPADRDGQPRSLFQRPGEKLLDRALAWDPLGEDIAVVTTVLSGAETLSTVWLVGEKRDRAIPLGTYPIAATEYGPEALQWSSVGESLVYTLGTSGAVILIKDTLVQLPPAYDNSAWWAPDGAHLFSPGLGAIVDRQGQILVTLVSPDPRGPRFTAWAWSTDGQKLAYVISDENGGQELGWLDLTDPTVRANHRLEVAVTFPPQSLFWTPDGTALILDDAQPHSPIWRWDLSAAKAEPIIQDGFLLDLVPEWATPQSIQHSVAVTANSAIEGNDETIASASQTPSPTATIPTTNQAGTSIYQDHWLCFAVEVPPDWMVDGVSGGFAAFTPHPETAQPLFQLTNVHLDTPTLTQSLDALDRGSLGPYVQETRDFLVDDRPALWVTLESGVEFQFVVLVIAPDCGDGAHALFISARGADQKAFEEFLNHVRFVPT
jgi:hypothetical protein